MRAALCHHYDVIRARDVISHVTQLGHFPVIGPNRKQLPLRPLVSKIFSVEDADRHPLWPLTSTGHVTLSVT